MPALFQQQRVQMKGTRYVQTEALKSNYLK